jgi:hypothetical protein
MGYPFSVHEVWHFGQADAALRQQLAASGRLSRLSVLLTSFTPLHNDACAFWLNDIGLNLTMLDVSYTLCDSSELHCSLDLLRFSSLL